MSTELPAPPQAAQPPTAKKKGLPKWVITIIALVVIGGGVYAFNYFTNDAAQAKAGDCGKLSGTPNKPEYEAVACDNAGATHVVGKALSNTSENCGGPYDEFTQSQRRGSDVKLCLMPTVLAEGNCYNLDDTSTLAYTKVECTKQGVVKVEKVLKGTVDENACGQGAQARVYPEPKTTFCFSIPA